MHFEQIQPNQKSKKAQKTHLYFPHADQNGRHKKKTRGERGREVGDRGERIHFGHQHNTHHGGERLFVTQHPGLSEIIERQDGRQNALGTGMWENKNCRWKCSWLERSWWRRKIASSHGCKWIQNSRLCKFPCFEHLHEGKKINNINYSVWIIKTICAHCQTAMWDSSANAHQIIWVGI